MEKIVIFDPALGTRNIGDEIISDSINREMKYLFKNNFCIRYSTHTPLIHTYQLPIIKKHMMYTTIAGAKYKFIGGSNILRYSLKGVYPGWNINLLDNIFYRGSITIGCGRNINQNKIDRYTSKIYKSILNKDYIHSARDEKTKEFLNELGFKAINTGCATIWKLTPEHCESIPKYKSENVVFTLTDYNKDRINDQMLIDILKENYKNIFFWPQGSGDYDYFKEMHNTDCIKIVPPLLEEYQSFLSKVGPDYVGTRLHGGIFALQQKCRSIILSIDERARDMNEAYNLGCIERNEINNKLEKNINTKRDSNIKIDTDSINKWKEQFD